MSILKYLNFWFGLRQRKATQNLRKNSDSSCRRPQQRPLSVEVLEDRTVPSTMFVVYDSSASGFSRVGNWASYSGQGFDNTLMQATNQNGQDVATWTFTSLTPGM